MEFQIGDIVKLKKAHPCGIIFGGAFLKEKSRACFSQPVIGTDFRTPDRIKCLVCHIKRIWQKEKRVLPELSINNEKNFYKKSLPRLEVYDRVIIRGI